MLLEIRTVDHRTFKITFSEFKTVGELKECVCTLRGAWVRPEQQQLLYAGRVLDDKERLRTYCIDERKFLVMLPRPIRKKKIKGNSRMAQPPIIEDKNIEISQEKVVEEKDSSGMLWSLNKKILMKLGDYSEDDVHKALLLSLNNIGRAVEYLTDKIEIFPNMLPPPASNFLICLAEYKSRANKKEKNRKVMKNNHSKSTLQSGSKRNFADDDIYLESSEYEVTTESDDDNDNSDPSQDQSDCSNSMQDIKTKNWKKKNVSKNLEATRRKHFLNEINKRIFYRVCDAKAKFKK